MFRNVPYLVDKIIVTWYNEKNNSQKSGINFDLENKMGNKYDICKFKERFRKLRVDKGITQEALGNQPIGDNNHRYMRVADRRTISNWEKGSTLPNVETAIELCEIFDCEFDYLFGKIDLPHKDETDIQAATGLSEKAIQAIKNSDHYRGLPSMPSMKECSGNPKDMLDKLLQDVRFHDVLTQIGHYYNGILSLENHEAAFQEMQSSDPSDYENALATVYESGMVVIRPEGAAEHHLYLACEKLKEIVRDFSNKEKEARSENGKE